MRSSAQRRGVPAGALLLLLLVAGPLLAAGPPPRADTRRAWLYDRGSIRRVGPERWRERGPDGKVTYREHFRTREYVELFEPTRKRYYRLYPWGQYAYQEGQKHYLLIRSGRWAHPGIRPLDTTRNASHRGQLATDRERNGFPRLGDEYEVLAPATARYNCIGWSLGDTSSWVWPRQAGQPATLDDFDSLYAYHGYRRVNRLDYRPDPDQDRVVLYARGREDGGADVTHAARQLRDGSWSSKLGSLPLIRHLHPDDVAGPSYGVPWVMYVRARPGR